MSFFLFFVLFLKIYLKFSSSFHYLCVLAQKSTFLFPFENNFYEISRKYFRIDGKSNVYEDTKQPRKQNTSAERGWRKKKHSTRSFWSLKSELERRGKEHKKRHYTKHKILTGKVIIEFISKV